MGRLFRREIYFDTTAFVDTQLAVLINSLSLCLFAYSSRKAFVCVRFLFWLNVKQQHGDVAQCLSRNGSYQRAIAAENTKSCVNL